MADWVQPYSPIFEPQGDSTSQMLDKLNRNQRDIYNKLNRIRKFDASNTPPADQIDNHLWFSINEYALKRWNGTNWARVTVIGISNEQELLDVISGLGNKEGVIKISEPIKLTDNRTIPENIQLKFLRGAYIDSDTSIGNFTLTINGGIDAGFFQIFGNDLTVAGDPKIMAVYPEWFGAIGNSIHDDTDAIQKAENLQAQVLLFSKKYKITKKIVKNNVTSWIGVSFASLGETNDSKSTVLCDISNDDAIVLDNPSLVRAEIEFRNLKIKNQNPNSGRGIYVNNVRALKIEDVNISEFMQENIKLMNGGEYYINRVYSNRAGAQASIFIKGSADIWISTTHASTGNGKAGSVDKGIDGFGFLFENCNSINLSGCRGEVSTLAGCKIDSCYKISITDSYFDNNRKNGLVIRNSSYIKIANPKIFSNGNGNDSDNAGISIYADNATASDIQIFGGYSLNEDGTQDYGITMFTLNGGKLEDVHIEGINVKGNNVKNINGLNLVDSYIVRNCKGHIENRVTFKTDTDFTYQKGLDGLLVVANGTLSADRSCTLSAKGLTVGETFDIQRTAGGSFAFRIFKPDGTTQLTTLNQAEGITVLFTESKDFRVLKKYNLW